MSSDERIANEIAKILGEAIGRSNLKWERVSDEQFPGSMAEAGMSPGLAKE